MRHREAPYIAALAALLLVAAPADARTVTLRSRSDRPLVTIDLPAGFRTQKISGAVRLVHGRQRFLLFVCPLFRETRDMTGDEVARSYGGGNRKRGRGIYGFRDFVSIAARGGGCVQVGGRTGLLALAPRLHPRLGPATPTPPSDAAAEPLARAARDRTMAAGRVQGTVSAQPFGETTGVFTFNYEWDLAAPYIHYTSPYEEVVRDRTGDYVRDDPPTCWGGTSEAKEDDTLEPRLEMSEQDIPPTTTRAWRVAYAAPEPQPDGSTLVRWTGFVSDGFAVIGADGLLRRVHADDHGEAVGRRTEWRSVDIAFTAFPAAITPVRPEPACPPN